MQAREFASEVQSEPVTRNIFANCPAVETLENMLPPLRRNWRAGVLHRQHDVVALLFRGHANLPSEEVILPRVLEKVLHDESDVTLLPRDEEIRRKMSS